MDESTHSFAQWLRYRRQALHLTQRQLGDLARCSEAMIRKIEADERMPSHEVAQHLAVALQVPERDRAQFLRWARGEYVRDPLPQSATEAAQERPLRAPTNVPTPLNALIGRQNTIKTVIALLVRPTVRLVTLTGTGGVGKTRLSYAVAEALGDVFVDGIFFVNLAPVSDPALVLATIAATLDVKESVECDLLTSLQTALHDRQLLVLLDNFEQVVDAGPVVADLLRAAPSVKVLATSRASLHIQGEREVLVKPLGVPTARKVSPDTLEEYDATRLFLERARAMDATFEASPDDARAIATICARLDGLPLAIELAAARIKVLPPVALLQRLDEHDHGGLNTLTIGARDLPKRQRTLQATIEWSYNLLDADEQTVFVRLAVFVGGWTLEAAEAICDATSDLHIGVLDALESLIDKHLIRSDLTSGEQLRFGMFQTIHDYALNRFAQRPDADAVYSAHANYYIELAERANTLLFGKEQKQWLDRVEAEYDNIRAVIRRTLERQETETMLRLGGALWRFQILHGYVLEGRAWLEEALAMPHTVVAEHIQANALLGAGALVLRCRDIPRARMLLERSLELHRKVGDKQGIATALSNLAILAMDERDYARATSFGAEILTLRRELGDRVGVGAWLNNMGHVAVIQGDYERASELYSESQAIMQEQGGNEYGVSIVILNRGIVALRQGQYRAASSLFLESLVLCEKIDNKGSIAWCFEGLAGVAANEQQPLRGARLFGAASALRQRIGIPLPNEDRPVYEQHVALAREQIESAQWDRAWSDGQTMSLDEAITYARDDTPNAHATMVHDEPR